MTQSTKQHLIDPEICIRCYTCEDACPIGAITHNDDNVVVDAAKCDQCMDCISPCPTGSIDNWRVVLEPYSLEEQFAWLDLPEQARIGNGDNGADTSIDAIDDEISALLAAAHAGAGGMAKAPVSASKPTVNLYNRVQALEVTVQGNYRLTAPGADSDVRHLILNPGNAPFPLLEGQSVGITPPGCDSNGKPYRPRLYSVSSPRDGERPNTNNLSLTVKREKHGVCSNYVCDLEKGERVKLSGPYGATFLLPNDPMAKLIMVCTGTGSAPFRAFTMQRQRTQPGIDGSMLLFFGARTADALPYFGPLKKIPESFLEKHFAFSRVADQPRTYVQDKLRAAHETVAALLTDPATHVYICGLKTMEAGVESAFEDIARGAKLNWSQLRESLRESGRYHVETY